VIWFILMVLLFFLEAGMLLWLILEPDVVSDQQAADFTGESLALLVFATAWVCIVPAVRLLAAPYTALAQFWHVRQQVWALRTRRDHRWLRESGRVRGPAGPGPRGPGLR
jgi:hypothetical protein